jgi:peptidyl-prolyl cis-trans isomerase A (cyclophilin A)
VISLTKQKANSSFILSDCTMAAPTVYSRRFAIAVGVFLLGATGFSSPPHRLSRTASSFSTVLGMNKPRRSVLGWIRKAVLTTAGVSTVSKTLSSPEAFADETNAGKIVEFTLNNLDGEIGKVGTVKIQLQPDWAPKGVARFEELTSIGFCDDCRVFRVLPGFVCQFGINGNPTVQQEWRGKNLSDDPVRVSNERGTVVFATAGPNSRTTQIFINTREQGNTFLDKQGFAPIGKVIEGMDVVDRMYAGYGEGAPAGKGPNQGRIQLQGNSYLKESFPKLTYISKGILCS